MGFTEIRSLTDLRKKERLASHRGRDAPGNTYLEHLLILLANAATSFLETLSKLSATTTLSLTSYYTHSRAKLKAVQTLLTFDMDM